MLPENRFNNQSGNTLIGVIIAAGILAILISVVFLLVSTTYQIISFTRARTSAKNLAQEKIEIIKNLSYDNIGTNGGIPQGILPEEEVVERNGQGYIVTTQVIYVDDPFDDTAPVDTDPTDYKRATVTVSWEDSTAPSTPIILSTDIAPSAQQSSDGTGILEITVFDSNGFGVVLADVHIYSEDTDPITDFNFQSDLNGQISLPGTPVCADCYEITATKEDYSTDKTYSSSEVTNPAKSHATVLAGQLTQISFAIDETSQLSISTVGTRVNNFPQIANVAFTLKSDKLIGTDSEGFPVYKYSADHSTDGSGNLVLLDMEWGSYEVIIESIWDIAGSNPILPAQLLPGVDLDLDVSLSIDSTNSILVAFTNDAQNPVADVEALIINLDTSEEYSAVSGSDGSVDFGQMFFPSLEEATHSMIATAAGYLDINTEVYPFEDIIEKFILQNE